MGLQWSPLRLDRADRRSVMEPGKGLLEAAEKGTGLVAPGLYL